MSDQGNDMATWGEAAELVDKLGQCKTKGDMLALVFAYRRAVLDAARSEPLVPSAAMMDAGVLSLRASEGMLDEVRAAFVYRAMALRRKP